MKILGFLCVSEWSCHGLENPGDEKTAGWDRRPKAGFKDIVSTNIICIFFVVVFW